MTIPGKGGRPRKWRNDADRQRAWRARQAGDDEPLTVVEAIVDGDELAGVWQIVQHLGEQLEQATITAGELRRERDRAQRELDREQHRFGWLETRITDVEAERDRVETERAELAVELMEVREELAYLRRAAVSSTESRRRIAVPSALPRAQRRQLERQQRRQGA